jgi:hypothetical protein
MYRSLAIVVLLLALFARPQPADAMIEFDFTQTASSAPLTFQYTIGFDDSAAATGYSGNFGFNLPGYWPALSWDFGALEAMRFSVGSVLIDLSTLAAAGTCGIFCTSGYTWFLNVTWAGAGSLPVVDWYFNDTQRDVSFSGTNAGLYSGGYDNDCCVVPCEGTGACTFSGTLAQVGEPRLTVAFLLLGLASLAWLRRRRAGLGPGHQGRGH